MTMIVKIGYLDAEKGIQETHWFHSAFQCIAIAFDAQTAQRLLPAPAINAECPSGAMKAHGDRIKAWSTEGWADQCASLPAHHNPFLQRSSGENGSSILIPP